MKTLLILLTLIAFNTQAACLIDLGVKKKGAKTYYLGNGERLSKSVISKLSSVCKFNVKVLSKKRVKSMKINRLQKRLAKLQKDA